MKPIFIYTLNCPTTGTVRYCGQTGSPDRRLNDHLNSREAYYSARWVKSLLAKNLRPIMEILDVVPDTEADFWEREYIQNFRERGFNLTNFSDGGNAPMRGKKLSPEHCAKMSAANLGKKLSPEHRAKIGAANQGKKRSMEHREKVSASMRGKTLSLETREKISASLRGKKRSPEHCASLSAAKRGKKLSPEHRAALSAAKHGRKKDKYVPSL